MKKRTCAAMGAAQVAFRESELDTAAHRENGTEDTGSVVAVNLDDALTDNFAKQAYGVVGVLCSDAIPSVGSVAHVHGDLGVNGADVVLVHSDTQPFNIISLWSDTSVGPPEKGGLIPYPLPQRETCWDICTAPSGACVKKKVGVKYHDENEACWNHREYG